MFFFRCCFQKGCFVDLFNKKCDKCVCFSRVFLLISMVLGGFYLVQPRWDAENHPSHLGFGFVVFKVGGSLVGFNVLGFCSRSSRRFSLFSKFSRVCLVFFQVF